jgi:hypothetical protein
MSDIENKPKRVMSDEQKAKMKAGRERAKAAKEAAVPAPAPEPAAAPAEPLPETPKKKAGRKPKAAPEAPKKEVNGVEPEADEKVPVTSKKTKKAVVPETAPENKTETEAIICFGMNLKNDNWDEGDDESEKWFQDRTYFASSDALRLYLTDRVYNWTDEFAVMFRAIANDRKSEITHMIDIIVSTPFLANHAFNEVFNVFRCNVAIHH